jgi:hypothetical protein
MTRELRRAAWERQRGVCAATGLPLGDPDSGPWHLHHRLPGGMGGTTRLDRDVLSNVVAVLAEAHNMGSPGLIVDGVPGRSIHTDPHWSRGRGLLLSAGRRDDPAEVPVHLAGCGWGFLTDAGGWVPLR